MNTLKATQIFLPATAFFSSRDLRRSRRFVSFFSKDSYKEGSSSPSQGDRRKQELLAQIALLQAQKVRITNFLDERSANLTKFGEEANAEFDRIGEDALKGLDEAESRIMENLDNQMDAFEESAEMNKQEIEKNEQILRDFEEKIERDRNEGLFFKNLRTKSPKANAEAKVEAQKIKEVTIRNTGFKIRRNIYLALMFLLAVTIANAVTSFPEVDWGKVGALALILAGLLAQVIYEKGLQNQSTTTDDKDNGEGSKGA